MIGLIYEGTIEGKFVKIRTILSNDAEKTLKMRLNKEKTRFLHPVDDDIDKQLRWIESIRKKEGDYFLLLQTWMMR